MTAGSKQLRIFRTAIRDQKTLSTACVLSGLSREEGRLTLQADAADPPGPECFEPIGEEKGTDMARPAKAKEEKQEGNGGVYNPPNAERALKIYKDEIAPKKAFIAEKTGDLSDPYRRIKDECHFPKRILNLLVELSEMEESKRDHNLLALHLGLRELKFSRPFDLVARAEGADEDEDIVPAGAKGTSDLVTVQ